jgi:hypothetical protein
MSTSPDPTWTDLRPGNNPGQRVAGAIGFDPLHGATIFTLGRSKFEAGDPVTDPPSQNVQRSVWGLVGEQATPTTEPTTPAPVTDTPDTPVVTDTPGTVVPSATPTEPPDNVCGFIKGRVPASVISNALANPASVAGYGLTCNPNLPEGRNNPVRSYLSLWNTNVPYNPLYNSVVWKCGCP